MRRGKEIFKPMFPIDLRGYKSNLLKEFDENPVLVGVLNKLFLEENFDIVGFVKGIEGNDFVNYDTSYGYHGKLPNLEDISNIEYDFKYVYDQPNHPYIFFSRKEYDTYETLTSDFKGFYYVTDKDLFKKIDKIIFKNLGDYRNIFEDGLYSKEIQKQVYLHLKPSLKWAPHLGITDYIFPEIFLEADGKMYSFFLRPDLFSFLFLGGASVSFFYLESTKMVKDKYNSIVQVLNKDDEPVVYKDEKNEKFILTNSHEKLAIYNKYLFILIDMYTHFFRVFEKWLINSIKS